MQCTLRLTHRQLQRRLYATPSKAASAQPISLPKLDSSTVIPAAPVSETTKRFQGQPSRIPVPTTDASTESQLVTLTLRTKALDVEAPAYGIEKASFPYIWLRDVCEASTSVDPNSKQKLFKLEDIDQDIKPLNVSIDEQAHTLTIQWDRSLKGRPKKGETSTYDLDFLRSHSSYDNWRRRYRHDDLEAYRSWDNTSLKRSLVEFPYEKVDNPSVVQAALKSLVRDGIVFFKDVPTSEKDPEKCTLVTLASKLGRIMDTWYGDKCFAVRSLAEAKNIAYTSLPLDLHMDLLHFEAPPRYQFLHCLYLDEKLQGGESYFVDAYKGAEVLRRTDREAFDLLCKENIGFEYLNDGHWTYAERPTFEFSKEEPDRLYAVNYSPAFQAPLRLYPTKSSGEEDPTDRIRKIHAALTKYSDILKDPNMRYERQLKEGECVAFDNRRVLHARRGFNAEGASGEIRLLMGCYVDDTSVKDRFRVLQDKADIPDV